MKGLSGGLLFFVEAEINHYIAYFRFDVKIICNFVMLFKDSRVNKLKTGIKIYYRKETIK